MQVASVAFLLLKEQNVPAAMLGIDSSNDEAVICDGCFSEGSVSASRQPLTHLEEWIQTRK